MVLYALATLLFAALPSHPDAAVADPLAAGIETLVNAAIAEGKLPGCVVAIGRKEGVLYERAFGHRALQPEKEAMTVDTIFDLASLTKPVATAASILILRDQGKLDLDGKVSRYLPEFTGNGKQDITLRQGLTHSSGLPAETRVGDFDKGKAFAFKRIYKLKPRSAPGARFAYSDVGFIVLGELINKVAGRDLAAFTHAKIFAPLGMRDTGFLPAAELRPRIAPTEQRKGVFIRGDVHDPRAYRLGGVAGHAGLFSTAADLARFARMILARETTVLSRRSLDDFIAPHDVPDGIRALGWDVASAYSNNRGTTLSPRAIGHGGYTGTSLWIDPEQDLFIVFLSNRVHPDGKGAINDLAAGIATWAGALLGHPPIAPDHPALAKLPFPVGIDALVADDFASLRGARVALLTNDAARAGDGRRTTDVLAARQEFSVVALLSPEHGLSATRDERIKDSVDKATGLPIASLYGGKRGRLTPAKGPRPVTLPPGIDTVVVDLPDVGVRFFTYAGTLHAVLIAAARRGLRVLVLDRPNPQGGTRVLGPVLARRERSPVNHHPLPILHGMTLGELALLMNADDHLGARLEITRMPRYDRATLPAETGLPFFPPSPNLRTPTQVWLYPAIALLEGTNISVGRGTETPFEHFGAPFIDGEALAKALSAAGLAGIHFAPTTFTPKAGPYKNTACHGLRATLEKPADVDPVRTGFALIRALHGLYPKAWNTARLHRIVGDPAVTAALLDGKPDGEIAALFAPALEAWKAKRAKYLLYP